MYKAFCGLSFIFLLLSSCKGQSNSKVWTKKYEQGLYNYLDSTSKPSMPIESKRSKYILFIIKRLKQEIPDGLNSVSKDSLHSLNIRIGREYAMLEYGTGNTEIIPSYMPWTPMIEKTFRDDYTALLKNKYPNTINKFCDCMINKFKAIYPDSILIPVPKDINLKVSMDCK
ncbi:hypothetical protein, partial [Mucilaginibacter sp.]|uniref:hypothetical protein n=1 Tax=Mucilaginibacter sp. TaxID=1882438 RepID=UPI0031B58497